MGQIQIPEWLCLLSAGPQQRDREIDRIWRVVQDLGGFNNYVVFDTTTRHMAINLHHLSAVQFNSRPGEGVIASGVPQTKTVDVMFHSDGLRRKAAVCAALPSADDWCFFQVDGLRDIPTAIAGRRFSWRTSRRICSH